MSVLTELRDRRAGVWGDMETLLDESAAEGMSHEQAERHAALEAEFVRLDNDVKAREKAEKIKAALEEPQPVPDGIGKPSPQARDLIREDREYAQSFSRYMRSGLSTLSVADRQRLETRAQSVGTDSAGGFLVPDIMRDRLIERMVAFGGLATAVEEITTTGGETLRWPSIDDTANEGVIAAENTAPASGGADLVFTEKTLGAFRYVAPGTGQLPLRVSVELLQDSHFDIQDLVTRKLGERIARIQAKHWVTGAGTTEPFGIDTGTAGTAFTSAGITYAELVAAVHEVDPAYRTGASWSFNDATMAKIESIVDGNGRPILNTSSEGITAGPTNSRLLGYPVVIEQAFADYADGTTNKWGVFGDLREGYVIRRVRDLTLIVNPYTRANEGQVEYVLWARADGTVQNPNSFRVLINAV